MSERTSVSSSGLESAITPQSSVALESTATPAPVKDRFAACSSQANVDVLHHAAQLDVELEPAALAGRGTLRLRWRSGVNSEADGTRWVTLDTHGLTVTSAKFGEQTLAFRQESESVCVQVPAAAAAQPEWTLDCAWEVPATGGKMPHFAAQHVWAGYRTSAWMPTAQEGAQRATLDLTINAAAALRVAASGRLVAAQPGARAGYTAHHFVLAEPTPVFLFGFAVGHFETEELSRNGVRFVALGPAGRSLTHALKTTAEIHRKLVEHTGLDAVGEQYVQVFLDEADAAQEAAGIAFIANSALDDLVKEPEEEWVLTHELAHQWFGRRVPCADFRDFWLNEGFATFFVGVSKELRFGRAAYETELKRWKERSDKVHAAGKDAPLALSRPGEQLPPLRDGELQARGVTYTRGALLLDKLRSELGARVFWQAIRAYVKHAPSAGARTEDLQRACEVASKRDLTEFFARWVYAPASDW